MDSQAVDIWYSAVSVATVWTSPTSVREVDKANMTNPVHLTNWLDTLTFESKLDLCDSNRIQTQLLYGEPVIVEEIVNDWAKIIAVWQASRKDERGYPGWVPVVQLKKAAPIHGAGFAKVTKPKVQLWGMDGNPTIILPFNTLLPFTIINNNLVKVCTPDGTAYVRTEDVVLATSVHQFEKWSAEQLIEKGLTFLDLPYLWGGMSSYGFDCSGFVYNLFKAGGYFIPRDASDQAEIGKSVSTTKPSKWRKGDLLFFGNEQGSIRHVGFYYGNHQMLHSPSNGKTVEIIPLTEKWLEELKHVRRYRFGEGAK